MEDDLKNIPLEYKHNICVKIFKAWSIESKY